MARNKYTPEQRAEALDIYTTDGLAEAAEQTGIPAKTISSWASRAGKTPELAENRQIAIDRSRQELEYRRLMLAPRVQDELEALLDAISGKSTTILKNGDVVSATSTAKDKQACAMAFGILFDKQQLMLGGPTSSTVSTTDIALRDIVAEQKARNQQFIAATKEG